MLEPFGREAILKISISNWWCLENLIPILGDRMHIRFQRRSLFTRILKAIRTCSKIPLFSPKPPRAMTERPPTELHPSEPPRKRRRKVATNTRAGFKIPENTEASLFRKTDWIIDGIYRRVPPYYYVLFPGSKH